MRYIWFFIAFFYALYLYPQDISYAKKVISVLSSQSFYGRGYVFNGHIKAANYIRNEFNSIGLDSLSPKGYFQFFPISVNTFPQEASVIVQNKKWTLGTDFIISPSSPTVQTELNIRFLKSKKIEKAKKPILLNDKAVFIQNTEKTLSQEVIKKIYSGFVESPVLFVPQEKLTHRMATKQNKVCVVEYRNTIRLEKPKKAMVNISAEFFDSLTTQNIIGYVKGTVVPDSFIVFTAHYDHLGAIGKEVYFPGANDNASGIAMLLSLAKYYVKNPARYSVAFIAFGAEEVGLLGSKFFVENPLIPIKNIRFLLNMDIMGTGDEGIQVVNATEHEQEFELLKKINEEKKRLKEIKPRGKAANSDHYWFSEEGVPSFFIYTLGGIKAYHDVNDKYETLPLTKFEEVFYTLTNFVHLL